MIGSIRLCNHFSLSEIEYERACNSGDAAGKKPGFVSGERFSYFGSLRRQGAELTLSQIAQRAELDSGTAFRLVKTLVMLGYLRQVENAKRYYLGLKVLDLGFHAISRMDLHASGRPILRGLVGQLNEAASIGVLDNSHVVYIERVQAGLARLGVNVRIGSRIPAYCTALGHSILAYLPFEQRVGILNMQERVKLTPRTPVTIPEIEERLERCGGWATHCRIRIPSPGCGYWPPRSWTATATRTRASVSPRRRWHARWRTLWLMRRDRCSRRRKIWVES